MCVCIYLYVYVSTRPLKHTRERSCRHERVRKFVQRRACFSTYCACVPACVFACVRAHDDSCLRACVRAYSCALVLACGVCARSCAPACACVRTCADAHEYVLLRAGAYSCALFVDCLHVCLVVCLFLRFVGLPVRSFALLFLCLLCARARSCVCLLSRCVFVCWARSPVCADA